MTTNDCLCKFSKCQEEFQTKSGLVEPMVAEHQFYYAYSKNELYSWCRFCEEHVWELASTSGRESHFEGHVEQAMVLMENVGTTRNRERDLVSDHQG
jgi:hypothetical protein